MWNPDMWQAIQDYRNNVVEKPSKPKRHHKRDDIDHTRIGMRFGRLAIIKYVNSNKQGRVYECACDCGAYKDVPYTYLKNHITSSCGCLRREHGVRQCEYMNHRRDAR